MPKVFIYTLVDPRSDEVKYVGKTVDPKTRLRKHITETNTTYKCQWVKGLKTKGLIPIMEIIDECLDTEWESKERFYIRLFKSIGATLVNTMEGGEGGPTMQGRKLTPEQCAKITASKLGKSNPGAAFSNKFNKGFKILQLDAAGNLIAEHGSIRDAAKAVGRNYRRIQAMISGAKMNGKNVNSVAGYVFKRAQD